MTNHDPALHRLLSGRESLSRPEREAIFDRVWDGVRSDAERSSSSTATRWSWLGIPLAFTAAAAVVGAIGLAPRSGEDSEFGVRGVASGPLVTLRCAGSSRPGHCGTGDELRIELAGAAAFSHVAVFSRRFDGTVIWYTPASESKTSDPIEANVETTLVPRTIELDEAHPPGLYEVNVVLSREPLTREGIRRRFAIAAPSDVRIIERELRIR